MTGWWLVLAMAIQFVGLAWFALAMEVHWQQVGGAGAPGASAVRGMRLAGMVALALSFVACVQADHVTIAVLVWVMGLAACALAIAFLLSSRPAVLRPLVPWARAWRTTA